jgi:cytochrome c5
MAINDRNLHVSIQGCGGDPGRGGSLEKSSSVHVSPLYQILIRYGQVSLRAIVRTSLFAAGLCAAAPADQHKVLLDKYCVTCHNQKLNTGNLALDRADITRPGDDAGTWERVVRKLKNGQMPPAGLPRPTDAEARATASYLLTSLETAAAAHPNPGRTSAHRLNRAEYSNAPGG